MEPQELPNSSNQTIAGSRFDIFTKFYSQAVALAASASDAKATTDEYNIFLKRILITIDTFSQLIFGLDEKNKSEFVLHGTGVLELIISLAWTSEAISKKSNFECDNKTTEGIQVAALKAIKTCVVRNATGRSRCRSAGVLLWLNQVLDVAFLSNNASLIEEAFTTLAAICLGNDLNALQASCETKPFIKKSKELFPADKYSSMHKKTLYLDTLFSAVQKEQTKLLKKIRSRDGNTKLFFNNLDEAEANLRIEHRDKHAASVKHYNHAMKILDPFIAETKLLDDFVLEIRSKRSSAQFELGNFEDCLMDTRILLEKKDIGVQKSRVELLKLHGKALMKVGKMQEGKEALAKLKVICPEEEDDEIMRLLNNLELQNKK